MSWELSNLLRAIAITIVVCIHASHHWWFGADNIVTLDRLNPEVLIDTAINQIGRFTVPLFVILSGFGLTKSEAMRSFSLGSFVQRRGIRILPPYLFFTLINLLFRSQFQSADGLGKLSQFGSALLDGSGDYHLYFLVIIIQCYIAYPLLRGFTFSPFRLLFLLLFTFALFTLRWTISIFGWFSAFAPFMPDSNQCIFWLPYFLIGIWLGQSPVWFEQAIQQFSSKQWGMLWAIAALLELTEFYLSVLYIGSAQAVGHYGRPSVVLLTLTFLAWSLSWQNWQKRLPTNAVEIFGGASFTTYLLHTQVLRLLQPLEILGGIAYLLIAAIASWAVGIAIWHIAKPLKGLNLMLGA